MQQFEDLISRPKPLRARRIVLLATGVRLQGRAGGYVLHRILPGSGFRLRATSAISKVGTDRRLLSRLGLAVAEACRAGTRNGWRLGRSALSPPRLRRKPAFAKPQAANANGSSFRLRFREKVGLPHFKNIAKDPARLFNFWVRRRGPSALLLALLHCPPRVPQNGTAANPPRLLGIF